ncbi:Uncharacterised protein [Moraxella atlantae]|uniref:Uncharacterized protein n=1 Tax=Faucicola atlantae TaxID=34059 RepID=A0A378Q3Y5_9GAMM|nr:Uncharacterised protein [Moraxella atlantae]
MTTILVNDQFKSKWIFHIEEYLSVHVNRE